jgi:hypothetical protein
MTSPDDTYRSDSAAVRALAVPLAVGKDRQRMAAQVRKCPRCEQEFLSAYSDVKYHNMLTL